MVEIAGFRAPDYVLLLIAYPALLVVTVVAWLATRVRPKGKSLLLQIRLFGLSFQIKNGHVERQNSSGEIDESSSKTD